MILWISHLFTMFDFWQFIPGLFQKFGAKYFKKRGPPRLDGKLKIHFLSALIFYAFECPNHKTYFGFPLLCKITKIKNFVASGAIKISITRSKWKSYNAYTMLSCDALSNILHIISYSKCTTRFSVTIKLAILLFKSYHNIFSLCQIFGNFWKL